MVLIWITAGLFVAVIASIPLRLSVHYVAHREWALALGNLIIGVSLAGIAAAQIFVD